MNGPDHLKDAGGGMQDKSKPLGRFVDRGNCFTPTRLSIESGLPRWDPPWPSQVISLVSWREPGDSGPLGGAADHCGLTIRRRTVPARSAECGHEISQPPPISTRLRRAG